MNGVFTCAECSTPFQEVIPPLWLEYWPTHCGVPAPLQSVLAVETVLAGLPGNLAPGADPGRP